MTSASSGEKARDGDPFRNALVRQDTVVSSCRLPLADHSNPSHTLRVKAIDEQSNETTSAGQSVMVDKAAGNVAPNRVPLAVAGAVAMCCVVAGCRSGQRPSAKQHTAKRAMDPTVSYTPTWLSPDGRLLLVASRGARVISVLTGREVWKAPAGASRIVTYGAAWSPTSDAICWVTSPGKGRDWQLMYARVPGGDAVDLHVEALTPRPRALCGCVCCGRSAEEFIVGALAQGEANRVYLALRVSRGTTVPEAAIVGAAYVRDEYRHIPMQLLRLDDQGTVLGVGIGNVYAVDPLRGSAVKLLDQEGDLFAGRRLVWGAQFGRLTAAAFAVDAATARCYFTVPVSGDDCSLLGSEVFVIDLGPPPEAAHLCYVNELLGPLGPLPDGRFVCAMVDSASKKRPIGGHVPPSHLHLLDTELAPQKVLTDGPARDELPVWSEALGRVIFRRNRSEIWSVSLDGGDARRLWAPDAERPLQAPPSAQRHRP